MRKGAREPRGTPPDRRYTRGVLGQAPRIAIALLAAWAALEAAPARAQAPSPAGPALPLPIGSSTGDPPAGLGGLSPPLAVLPLRLSLQPALLPVEPVSSSQPCEPREEASGNTFHGFPLLGYASLRLMPRLSLHGFSTLGCPTSAGISGEVDAGRRHPARAARA